MTHISWSSDFASFNFCIQKHLFYWQGTIQVSYAVLQQLLILIDHVDDHSVMIIVGS